MLLSLLLLTFNYAFLRLFRCIGGWYGQLTTAWGADVNQGHVAMWTVSFLLLSTQFAQHSTCESYEPDLADEKVTEIHNVSSETRCLLHDRPQQAQAYQIEGHMTE